jgi:hypothetical protein
MSAIEGRNRQKIEEAEEEAQAGHIQYGIHVRIRARPLGSLHDSEQYKHNEQIHGWSSAGNKDVVPPPMPEVVEINLHWPAPAKEHRMAAHRAEYRYEKRKGNRADPVNVRQRVECQSPLQTRRVVPATDCHPRMSKLVQRSEPNKGNEKQKAINQFAIFH